jgi:hypothetical protein
LIFSLSLLFIYLFIYLFLFFCFKELQNTSVVAGALMGALQLTLHALVDLVY